MHAVRMRCIRKISHRYFKKFARKKENCLKFWRARDSEHNEQANYYQE